MNYSDKDGNLAGTICIGSGVAFAGATNIWNPVGWALLGVATGLTIAWLIKYAQKKHIDNKTKKSLAIIIAASTTAPPPPPNKGGKGTKVSSKTLYEKKGKNGFHIDVENPGTRQGQIHLQMNGVKYYYNITNMQFYVGSLTGALAPQAIQNLLNDPNVLNAIAKGLTYLGY